MTDNGGSLNSVLTAGKGMGATAGGGVGSSAARDGIAIGSLASWLEFVGSLAANCGAFVWMLLGLLHWYMGLGLWSWTCIFIFCILMDGGSAVSFS